jgi:hypothetical protein
MADDIPPPPFLYDGLDPYDDVKSTAAKATEGVKKAAKNVGEVYRQARQPGMPLSVLANIAREAPLGSLLVAFLLGVAVARRR